MRGQTSSYLAAATAELALRTGSTPSSSGATYIHYRCPHDAANPRQAAAYPDHGSVSLRVDVIMTAIAGFLDPHAFSCDRAEHLAAEHVEHQARQEAHLRAELARTETAERGLISELEQPAVFLLDQLAIAASVLADGPPRIKEALLAAFDIQALYRSDKNQVTIWATLTDNTPRTIAALLADPSTDSDTGTATPGQDTFYHSAPAPI